MGGPWTIQGHYVTISKWRPEFQASSNNIISILIWIWVPGLPIEYYTENFLMKLGNILGKAMKIDQQTANAVREKYLRVCIEPNLGKPLVPFV